MRIINLAMLPVLGATLLAGCVMQSGEDQISEDDMDQTSQEFTSVPADSEDSALEAVALDGRAAAAAGATALGASTSVPTTPNASSWYSGSLAPGETQHWVWNNASNAAAHKVALSPVGANSLGGACEFRVIRAWDVQKPDGEHEFHFIIKNINSVTCGTHIHLAWKERASPWATGGIDVGKDKLFTVTDASPLDSAYFVGVSPTGATSTNSCQLEVTRTWYAQQPDGKRWFRFLVKNIGTIACGGEVQVARTTLATGSWSIGTISPGLSSRWIWNNASPLDRVYVLGLSPAGASGSSSCQLEVKDSYYVQFIDSDGNTDRKLCLNVKNIGSLPCSGTVLLNHL